MNRSTWAIIAALCLPSADLLAAAPEFRLGKEGSRAKVALSASLQNDADAQKLAEELQLLLTQITGGSGEAEGEGILLSIAEDFPEIAEQSQLKRHDSLHREDYLLRSSEKQLLIVGATPKALPQAVADLLHRWGYRRFLPGAAWEIIPKAETLKLQVDEVQRPDFAVRDIWQAGHFWEGEKAPYEAWRLWNRMGEGFDLNTRHAYGGIYHRNKAVFDANPDYYAEVNGSRHARHRKFNAANEDLLKLLVADAANRIKAEPDKDSISMEPSDLEGWDNTGEASKKIGSPSNQAVTMANAVAKEAAKSNKYVGIYAYYQHQAPPTIEVEPNIIVSFTTRLLSPDRNVFDYITMWRKQGVELFGIRDYSSVHSWDLSLPGRALGGNLDYLSTTIEKYKKAGARFYTSESSAAWAPYGLGYYLASRLLWDTKEQPEEIITDFMEKSFGEAAPPMQTFYDILNGEASVYAREIPTSKLYALLLEAWELSSDNPAVRTRLSQLTAYVRYVELSNILEATPLEEKATSLREVYDWVVRMAPMQLLSTNVVKSRSGFRRIYAKYNPPGDSEIQRMTRAAEENPITPDELLTLAREGAGRRLYDAPRPSLVRARKSTSSPWMRNAASFIFPLAAGDVPSATLAMRRFGFSGSPRYVVLDPSRNVIQTGRLSPNKTTVEWKAKAAGDYALIIESLPTLIKCTSPQTFYIMPDRGLMEMVEFVGSLHFAVPAEVEAQIEVGGQRVNEKINLQIISDDGEIVADDRNVNGNEARQVKLPKRDTMRAYEIKMSKPDEGAFEDAFIRFHGPFLCPVAMAPEAYAPPKEQE